MMINRNHMSMLIAASAMLLCVSASAAKYLWQGDEDSNPLIPSNYKDENGTVLTSLPPPGSSVQPQVNGKSIKFTDDSASFLASLSYVCPRGHAVRPFRVRRG